MKNFNLLKISLAIILLSKLTCLASNNLQSYQKNLSDLKNQLLEVKIHLEKHRDNITFLELTLNQIFNIKYQDLLTDKLENKKLDLDFKLKNLVTTAVDKSSSFDDDFDFPKIDRAYADLRTGPLIPEELALLEEIKVDNSHFKDLKLVPGQIQHGVTCGSHAIINAWAIEELLTKSRKITAANIFEITRPFFSHESQKYTKTGEPYVINNFIHANEICGQIPKLIENELDQINFQDRLNFLGYHTANIGVGQMLAIEEAGVHLQDKFTSDETFLNFQVMSKMRDKYKSLLQIPPYVEHFIYNSGNHWVLASVVQKPGTDAIIYFIDSLDRGAIDINHPIITRFILSLYENFVKK